MQRLYLEVPRDDSGNQHPNVRFAVTRFPCVVGRHDDCDRHLPLPFVSRHHCRFFLRDDAVWVEDLASHNGTFLNGERLADARLLRDGDRLSIGQLPLLVYLPNRPGAEPDWMVGSTMEGDAIRQAVARQAPV